MFSTYKSVNELHLVFLLIQIHSKMYILIFFNLHIQVLFHEPRNKGHSTFFVFNLYYIILVYLKFANWAAVSNGIWIWVEHVVAEQHVAAVVHVIGIGNVLVPMRMDNLSNENADPDAPFDSGQPETHRFVGVLGYGVISESESMVLGRMLGLYGVSACHMYAFSFVFGTVDNEELKFEDSVDSLVDFFQRFNVAFWSMNVLAWTAKLVVANKRATAAFLGQTDPMQRFILFTGHAFEVVFHGLHDADIIYLFLTNIFWAWIIRSYWVSPTVILLIKGVFFILFCRVKLCLPFTPILVLMFKLTPVIRLELSTIFIKFIWRDGPLWVPQ